MEKKAISLACRMDSERAIKLTKRIFEFLIQKGEVVHLETRIAPKILPHNGMDLKEMTAENTKFIISAGGDGTVLRVASGLSQRNPPPILGVNIGSIGFLDESNERTVFNDINKVLNGEFIIETCSKIAAYIVRESEEIKLTNALNEILIVSSKSSKVLLISVKINGTYLNRSYLDGVIISTAVGSTAYNLSAGGAIVDPSVDIMELTPLNSYARSGLKPIILPINSEIEIKLLRPRLNAKIVIDGQRTFKKIQPNTIIKIRKSNSHSEFIRLSRDLSTNYINRLRKKIIGTIRVPLDDSPESEEEFNSNF
ncbi:MAG: NAD(+)/NADH kinase [Candidatus Lokiarchaeota archaeon]|nr:NAD(+)/NADH kinase [Candidatus Lokiarchaeota archaeon]